MKTHQLVSEDKHSFVIRHPKGHDFTVAKAGLDPGTITKIQSLSPVQKFADGGIVEPDASATLDSGGGFMDSVKHFLAPGLEQYQGEPQVGFAGVPADPNQSYSDAAKQPPSVSFASKAPPAQAFGPPAPSAQVPGDGAPSAPSATTVDPNSPEAALNQTMSQIQKTIQGGPTAGAQGIKDMQAAYAQSQQAQAQAHAEYQKQYQAIDQELNGHMQAIAAGKIDPNRLWSSASSGNKIMAGIGLVLGGIGAGLTGQPNAALQMIQKRMDMDVEAQKANLGKEQTLFSMNMQRYKNVEAAETATKLQLNANLQGQLAIAGAKAQNAQAGNNAKLALLQLQMQAAQMKQQLAVQRVRAQSIGAGSGDGGLPIGQDATLAMSDPGYAKVAVPLVDHGKVYQARSEKDAEELKKSEALYKPVLDDVNLLRQLHQSGVLMSPEGRSRAQAAMGRLAMNVNELNGYNRFTETDHETISKMFNNPASLSSILTGDGATGDTLSALQTKMESNRQERLQGYRGMGKYKSWQQVGR